MFTMYQYLLLCEKISKLCQNRACVSRMSSMLSSTDVKGFPIVSADGSLTLVGYIDRSELRYVLERARKTRGRFSHTPCLFTPQGYDHDLDLADDGLEDTPERFFAPTSEGELQFWPWVNQTPMTVSPQLPLEIVMQIFKRLGPRVILVEDHGVLSGLVTVKDVLRFIATEKPEYRPSWDERGGLDGLLEELWTWGTNVFSRILTWGRRIVRR